jgi:hypothetical protein
MAITLGVASHRLGGCAGAGKGGRGSGCEQAIGRCAEQQLEVLLNNYQAFTQHPHSLLVLVKCHTPAATAMLAVLWNSCNALCIHCSWC